MHWLGHNSQRTLPSLIWLYQGERTGLTNPLLGPWASGVCVTCSVVSRGPQPVNNASDKPHTLLQPRLNKVLRLKP